MATDDPSNEAAAMTPEQWAEIQQILTASFLRAVELDPSIVDRLLAQEKQRQEGLEGWRIALKGLGRAWDQREEETP